MKNKRPPVKPATLCWSCERAIGGCSWSKAKNPQPVKGWKAEPTKIRVSFGESIDSYLVGECPLYVPDKRKKAKVVDPWST